MTGVIGTSPVIIKQKLVQVIPISELYTHSTFNDIKIWTNEEWMPIIGVEREKTTQKINRISNCYNWLYATEDCELLLENNDIIHLSDVVEDTKLFQMNYPISNILYLSIPENTEPEPHKLVDIDEALSMEKDNISLTDYINCKNFQAARQAFLNERGNLEPNTTAIWNFIELQQKMMLAEKVGFQPRIMQTSMPNCLRFKSSYEDIKYDYKYLNMDAINSKTGEVVHISRDYTYEEYLKEMSEIYSESYLVYPLFQEESGAWDLFFYKRSDFKKPLIEWREALFDYNNDYIYQIKTDNGFYQAGVGKLIIKNKS